MIQIGKYVVYQANALNVVISEAYETKSDNPKNKGKIVTKPLSYHNNYQQAIKRLANTLLTDVISDEEDELEKRALVFNRKQARVILSKLEEIHTNLIETITEEMEFQLDIEEDEEDEDEG